MSNSKEVPHQHSSIRSTKPLVLGFGIALLLVFSALAYSMWCYLPVNVIPSEKLTFPLTREGVTITQSSHQWRAVEPGDQVQPGTLYVPEVQLEFSDDTSADFICFFEDNEGTLMGDSFTFEVRNGTVEKQATHELQSSAGFADEANYRGYKYSSAPFWHLVIQKNQSNTLLPPKLIARIPLPPHS